MGGGASLDKDSMRPNLNLPLNNRATLGKDT